MKRMLCVILMMVLLCACSSDEVPAYQAQNVQMQAMQMETLPQSFGTTELPDGEPMLHLSNVKNSANAQYEVYGSLEYYDEELQQWKSYCTKANCSHYDESCSAWIGEGNVRFAMKGGICYYIDTDDSAYGLKYFEFCAMNPVTAERRSYYKVQAQENEEIFLGNAAICGDTAILNYSVRAEGAFTMQQYIQAIDLQTGKIITIMDREIQNGEVYELWGMNEGYIIMSYLHTGANKSFAAQENSFNGLPNHADFVMNQHRWVLLEYPIAENAKWSEQVAQYVAGSDLRLFNHSNFYRGTLYYVVNETVWSYNLQEHKSTVLFEHKGIEYMSCMDGKLFYLIEDDACFYFDLKDGTTTQIPQMEWFPLAESENSFYCIKISNGYFYDPYCIAKTDYYANSIA